MARKINWKRQHQVLKALGSDAVLWINPKKLSIRSCSSALAMTKYYRKSMKRLRIPRFIRIYIARNILQHLEPHILPEFCFKGREPIEGMEKYLKIKDLTENQDKVENSAWYKELSEQLKSIGYAKYKNLRLCSDSEVSIFLNEYVLNLVRSMQTSGYDLEKGAEIGTAHIDRDGSLVKSGSATDRFCVARIVGLKRFPLRVVGIHEDWAKAAALPENGLKLDRLVAKLRETEKSYQ